jgi:hypothetical protein
MNCGMCGDKGIVRVRYESGESDDFGVCVCTVGRALLVTHNAWTEPGIALWEVWACREQVPVEQMFDLADLLPAQKLPGAASLNAISRGSRESRLLNASRKKPRL